MKTLNEYAKQHGIKYRAAWNRYKAGKIPSAFKDDFGKILIKEDTRRHPLNVIGIVFIEVKEKLEKNEDK